MASKEAGQGDCVPQYADGNHELRDYWLEKEVTVPLSAVEISEHWTKLLEDSYQSTGKYSSFYDILDNCLDVSDFPRWTILHLLSSSPAYHFAETEGDCITVWLVDGFCEYVTARAPKPGQPPPAEVRKAAFLVAFRQKHAKIREMIVTVFDLHTDPKIYVRLVKKEIKMKRYDVAYDAVTRFKLQSHFTPKSILPVLLRENFLETMEVYVDGDTTLQRQFACFLDMFCVSKSEAEPLMEDLNISNDQKKFLKCGSITSFLKDFIKKFNIPRRYCPTLRSMLRRDALYAALYRKFVKFTINDEVFDETVKFTVGNSEELQRKLVYGMVRLGDDVIGAARYAAEFRMPLDKLPKGVKQAVERRDYENCTSSDDSSESGEVAAPITIRSGRTTKSDVRLTVKKQKIQRQKASKRGRGKGTERKSSKQEQQLLETSCWLEGRVKVPFETVVFTKQWFKVLENSYKSHKDYKFSDVFNGCCAKTDSIWWTTLHLIASCPDYFKATTSQDSMTSFLVRGFREYLSRSTAKPQLPPSKELKMAAFLVAFHQKHDIVFEIIFAVFDLYENAQMFPLLIEEEVRIKNYEIAARAVTILKLQSHFVPDSILFPLFLQDRYEAVNLYVGNDKTQQYEFVRLLDGFCIRKTTSELESLANSYELKANQVKQLHPDVMSKAVKRYVRKFNVPLEYWPNTKRLHDVETLRFVLRSKYEDRVITDENFEDFVMEIVGDSVDLRVKLVCGMANYGDDNGAAVYAVKFGVPFDRVPKSVAYAYAKSDNGYESSSGESSEVQAVKPEVARYNPNEMHWMVVEDPDVFQRKMKYFSQLQKGSVVVIDCEWKPVLNLDRPKLSVLQVATAGKRNSNVLIMDILTMNETLRDRQWSSFRDLLANESIFKLVYTFSKDLTVFADASPILKDVSDVVKCVIDMSVLCNNILDKRPELFPYYNGTVPESRSLESFILLCFNRKLDQSQQMSNWNRRPLNGSQLIYAAIDAYCLVDMFRVLLTSAQKLGLDLMSFTFISKITKKRDKKK